jgi:quinol monooxygenase YgiN
MGQEISVVAVAEAKPGCESDVAKAIRACVDPTRREDGCRLYSPHVDLDRPSRFVFVERWDSRAALAVHLETPHFLAMAGAFETLLKAPLEVMILQELQ